MSAYIHSTETNERDQRETQRGHQETLLLVARARESVDAHRAPEDRREYCVPTRETEGLFPDERNLETWARARERIFQQEIQQHAAKNRECKRPSPTTQMSRPQVGQNSGHHERNG